MARDDGHSELTEPYAKFCVHPDGAAHVLVCGQALACDPDPASPVSITKPCTAAAALRRTSRCRFSGDASS